MRINDTFLSRRHGFLLAIARPSCWANTLFFQTAVLCSYAPYQHLWLREGFVFMICAIGARISLFWGGRLSPAAAAYVYAAQQFADLAPPPEPAQRTVAGAHSIKG
jgi:hypothetical protein